MKNPYLKRLKNTFFHHRGHRVNLSVFPMLSVVKNWQFVPFTVDVLIGLAPVVRSLWVELGFKWKTKITYFLKENATANRRMGYLG